MKQTKKKKRILIVVSILLLCVIGIPVLYNAFFSETASYEELLKKSDENYINNVMGIDITIPQRERLIEIRVATVGEGNKKLDLSACDKLNEIFKHTEFKRVPSIIYPSSSTKELFYFSIKYDYHADGLTMTTFIPVLADNKVYFRYAVHQDKKFYLYQAKITDEQKQQLTDLLNNTAK